MTLPVRTVAVLVAALMLTGCTSGAPTTTPKPLAGVGGAAATSDLGDDRPHVTYDGLMVRRRVVIALHSNSHADIASLRKQLGLAATRHHTRVSVVSANVLDAADLERLTPDLVVALPAGATRTDAAQLLDPAFAEGRRIAADAQEHDVVPVLVHDLRFTVGTRDPVALASAIDREGILTDALGTYSTTLGHHELEICYTGPLLSDHTVASVRQAMTRPVGNLAPPAVTVSPRSTTGTGVDMTTEPTPAPALIPAPTSHHHGA